LLSLKNKRTFNPYLLRIGKETFKLMAITFKLFSTTHTNILHLDFIKKSLLSSKKKLRILLSILQFRSLGRREKILNFKGLNTRTVSCNAFFKRWLLLSLHPVRHCIFTSSIFFFFTALSLRSELFFSRPRTFAPKVCLIVFSFFAIQSLNRLSC